MCGIVGLITGERKKEYFDFFKELMKESQIRGKHASGFSFIKNNKIVTIKSPISSTELIRKLPVEINSNLFLGHTRYSTSSLKFNQPLFSSNISLVHNGVVTQLNHAEWEREFGYKTKTNNDSELLLKSIEDDGIEFLNEKFEHSSFSLGLLKNNSLSCLRNGSRPLWLFLIRQRNKIKLSGFCSTADIFDRALNKATIPKDSILYKCSVNMLRTETGILYEMRNMGRNVFINETKLFSSKDLQ